MNPKTKKPFLRVKLISDGTFYRVEVIRERADVGRLGVDQNRVLVYMTNMKDVAQHKQAEIADILAFALQKKYGFDEDPRSICFWEEGDE
jgi:hypothetical protein